MLLPLFVIGTNNVKFVFDSSFSYDRKISAITGDILSNIVDTDMLKSLFMKNNKFRLILNVDNYGKILSFTNRSIGVPDSIIDKFINVLKKENIDFYVYLGPDVKNKKSYLIDNIYEVIRPPYLLIFSFPGHILVGENEFNNVLYRTKPIPSTEKIKELCRKYMNIRLKTYSLEDIMSDFDIRVLQP